MDLPRVSDTLGSEVVSTSNWHGPLDQMPAWNKAKNRPVRDDIPYGASNRTLAERRASSAASLASSLEHKREQECLDRLDMHRRLLPLQERLEALGIDLDELIELIEARQKGAY